MENGREISTSSSTSNAPSGRAALPQISIYSGIPNREAVQVIQQALHRQPSTAAHYLQQMYAAQQQHLMLQTAALQQQHISNTHMQNLQANMAPGRQSSSQSGNSAGCQTNLGPLTVNTQLMNGSQAVSSSPAGITQQAILLGNASSPALTSSQAQMYLRAQMLIFTPTAPVTTVHPDQHNTPAQVSTNNLTVHSQQAPALTSPSQLITGLGIKPVSLCPNVNMSQLKVPSQGRIGEGQGGDRGTRRGTTGSAPANTLLTPACTQIQPRQQFVLQRAAANTQLIQSTDIRRPPTVFHSTLQPKPQRLQLAPANHHVQPAATTPAQNQYGVPRTHQPTPPTVPEAGHAHKDQQQVESQQLGVSAQLDAAEQLDTSGSTFPAQATGTSVSDRPNAACSVLDMTSGNGRHSPAVTVSATHHGDNKPPQAVVKPHVLTHVIEGFVIQEGGEPFPVERSSLLIERLKKQKQPEQNILADPQMEELSPQELKQQHDEPMLKCELCGLVDFAYKFKRSKRFCSTLCAKRYNVGCTKRMGLFHPDRSKTEKRKKRRSRGGVNGEGRKPTIPSPTLMSPLSSRLPVHHARTASCSDTSGCEESPSSLSHTPSRWKVEDVYRFISSLPGCEEIAEEFRSQEIDGQALLLLKEDHLMSTMNIKLGPALKIFAHISMLKDS